MRTITKAELAARMRGDTEHGTCNFCGDLCQVAVSEQFRDKVSICQSCAVWALDELRAARTE